MRISRSVFLLSSLTFFAFSGVEGGRKLKKAKKTVAPTRSPTSAPTPSLTSATTPSSSFELNLLVFKGIFSDIIRTRVPGDAVTGVGLKSIIFANGLLEGAPSTLTISTEVTSAENPGTIDTAITTVQLCYPSQLTGGCVNFETSSLFPIDPSSGKYPRRTGASSSGTGILFYDNPTVIDVKAGLFTDPIEIDLTFTTPQPELSFDLIERNMNLAANVPGFCPPEAFVFGDLPVTSCIDFFSNLPSDSGEMMARTGKMVSAMIGGRG